MVRTFDVAPGASTQFLVPGLPVGPDTFVGEAFASSCSAVTPSSVATWRSEPVSATLEGGVVVSLTLPLRRNGSANIGIDFIDEALTCTTVANAASCTSAVIPDINLGQLSGQACHDQCQVRLAAAGATTGCWVVAINTICFCRGGVLNLGGSQPGGSCN